MIPVNEEHSLYLRRLKWLMSARMLLAIMGIFAILLSRYKPETAPSPFKVYDAYYILVFACIINLFYLFIIKLPVRIIPAKIYSPKALGILQVSIDILLIAALVYLTGGVDSVFAYLFFASIVAAALLISAKASIIMASAATVFLCSVNILYYIHKTYSIALPLLSPDITEGFDKRLNFLLPYLFFFTLSLYMVAILAGKLAIEIERAKIFTDEILQNMADGVIAVDKNCKVAFINEQFKSILGIMEPAKNLIGKVCTDIPAIKNNPYLADTLSAQPKKAPPEVLVKTSRGEEKLVELKASALFDRKNRPRGVIIVLTDLSLKLKMEKAVKHAEMLQAISELSAGMAHEIRNPLSSIRGAAQELSQSLKLNSEEQKMFGIIMKESDRLNSILSNFFEYARRKTVKSSTFNLSRLLEDVALLMEKRENSSCRIERDFTPNIKFFGNPEQLKQALLNLGLNAIEASKPGDKVVIRAFYSQIPPDPFSTIATIHNGIILEISDNGPGIDPAAQDKLFTPFFTTKPHGTGMGLCIAEKIIRGHSGNITLQSVPRKGTTASVWLPLRNIVS